MTASSNLELDETPDTKLSHTVFVIGAGSGTEFGFPDGAGLSKDTQILLNLKSDAFGHKEGGGDPVIFNALARHGSGNNLLEACHHIREALPLSLSIDNFIDSQRRNKEIELCGKLAIVRAILKSEKSCPIEPEIKQWSLSALEKTWLIHFFKLLLENCNIDAISQRLQSVSLVIFNYDRSIEQFLLRAMMTYCKIGSAEAAELVNKINIYHPYGTVGSLPWSKAGGRKMGFGAEPTPDTLFQCSKEIKTFVEGTSPESSQIVQIRNAIGSASKLIFLGFAFHQPNMDLLYCRSTKETNRATQCFATAFEVSESDKKVIQEQVNDLYRIGDQYREPINVSLAGSDVKCSGFFKEYWRSLAF